MIGRIIQRKQIFLFFLPCAPHITYKEWVNIEDWIGPTYLKRNERSSLKYLSFEQARNLVRTRNFKNWDEFKRWESRPNNIPLKPNEVYKEEFKGRRDWLGLSPYFTNEKKYLDYFSARKYMMKLGVSSNSHFRRLKEEKSLPQNFPLNPEKFYKEQWIQNNGWAGFLGTNNTASKNKNYIFFNDLKKHIKSLQLSSKDKYAIFVRDHKFKINEKDLPSAPNVVYKSEWKGWADFLGKEDN